MQESETERGRFSHPAWVIGAKFWTSTATVVPKANTLFCQVILTQFWVCHAKIAGKLKGKQRVALGEADTDQDGRGALRHLVVSISEGEDAEHQAGRDDGFDE